MEIVRDITVTVEIDTNKQTYFMTFGNITDAQEYYDSVLERL